SSFLRGIVTRVSRRGRDAEYSTERSRFERIAEREQCRHVWAWLRIEEEGVALPGRTQPRRSPPTNLARHFLGAQLTREHVSKAARQRRVRQLESVGEWRRSEVRSIVVDLEPIP